MGAIERVFTVRSRYQATRTWRHSWLGRLGMSRSYLWSVQNGLNALSAVMSNMHLTS
jgi:hypothetical protein